MIRPRELVARGRIRIDGIWVSRALLGEDAARRRTMALADSRARIVDVADGYLVELAAPEIVFADECGGTPVVLASGAWLSVPLRPDELAALAPPPGAFVLACAGRAEVVPPGAHRSVDVAAWIDVGDFEVIDVEPVADEPIVVVTPRATTAEVPEDVRKVLGAKVPKADPEQAEIMSALRGVGAGNKLGAARPGVLGEGHAGEDSGGGLRGALRRWLAAWLDEPPQRAIGSGAGAGRVAGKGGRAAQIGGTTPSEPPKPGWLRRVLERWVSASPLAQVIGRRQAAYVLETLRMFESGELEQALRRAIPFSSLPGAPRPPSLSVPSPRASLELRAVPEGEAATGIHLGDSLYDRFRELYRKAARDLEAKGRIEEAAFVLFSLLGENDEGVALLERHERHALAAQMAEGRDMPAGLVIRLWFLAGDAPRAVAVARRTGAFADAISRLQPTHPDLAMRLRVLWADRLAGAGDFAAAVDAVWEEPRARALARRWIDLAIAFGGPKAMTMLARKLERFHDDPAAVADVQARVLALLDGDDDETIALRLALGRAWYALGRPWAAPVSAIAGPLTRRLMIDASLTGRTHEARDLLCVIDDPVLRADAEGTGIGEPSRPGAPVLSPVFAAHERGLTPISDAVRLANGRWLLALGDAGMRVVDGRGRTLYRYEHPASRLVASDHGTHAIAVIERGKTRTLTRVDLVTGRAERWCDARFESFVETFDGATWFVTTEDAVVAVDAQAPGFDALWRVGRLEDPVVAIARGRTHLAVCLHGAAQRSLALWRYELTSGGPVLRERRPLDLPNREANPQVSVHPSGRVVARVLATGHVAAGRHVGLGPTGPAVLAPFSGPGRVVAREHDALHVRITDDGAELHRLAADDLVLDEQAPCLTLHGTTEIGVRVQDDGVVVTDDRGRLIALDLGLVPRQALFV